MKSKFWVLVLMTNYFLFGLLLNSIGVLILQSMQSFEIGKDSAKFLEGCKDIPIAVVSFFAATFIPRLGYRLSMMCGLTLVTFACIAMPVFASFWVTKLFLVSVGAAFAFMKISIYSSIGLISNGSKEHASIVNRVEAVFTLGVLSGFWLFGAFIDSSSPGSLSWLNAFWVLAGLSAFNLLLTALLKFDKFESCKNYQLARKEKIEYGYIQMLRLAYRPLTYIFILSAFLYVLIEQGISSWLPTYNKEVLKLSTVASIQLASAFAFFLVLGRISAGYILRSLHWVHVLTTCVIAIMLLVMLTLPSAKFAKLESQMDWYNLPFAAYLFPLIGFFLAPIYPSLNSVVLSALHTKQQPLMAGLTVIFSALGGTVGSIIIGSAFTYIDGADVFYISLIPLSILLYLFGRLDKEVRQMETKTTIANS